MCIGDNMEEDGMYIQVTDDIKLLNAKTTDGQMLMIVNDKTEIWYDDCNVGIDGVNLYNDGNYIGMYHCDEKTALKIVMASVKL